MFVTGLLLADARQLCNRLDKILGIPAEGLPGIGGPGRTETWAKPIPMADGTYAVPVPRKGLLKDALEELQGARKAAKVSDLTDDQTDLTGAVRVKVIGKLALDEVLAQIDTARKVQPEEWKATELPK